MSMLIVQSGKHRGKQLKVPTSDIKIGRDPHCQIRIPSTEISREHCILKGHPDGVVVIDLGSKNGTYVNGLPISGAKLIRPGDTLHVGPMIFEVGGKKKKTSDPSQSVAVNTKGRKKSDSASEHDIASWLGDEGIASDNIAGDTTLVTSEESLQQARQAAKEAARARDVDVESPSAEVVKDSENQPQIDRASELIKKFWASKKSQTP